MPLTSSESIALLEKLISIASPSGGEGEASAWLADWMARRGFDARVDAVGNAVGSRGGGLRHILLLGHIDTFPGQLPVRREGDWLYGRGTVDAKGPLCAFVAAAAEVEVPPGWRVTVVGAVEEEAATSRGARHLIAGPDPLAPDLCVVGEPSSWDRVTLGYKGRLLAEVRLRAPFAHSAGQTRLPAEQAVDLWNTVVAYCADFNDGRQKAFDRLDPSLRHIVTRDQGAYGTAEMGLGFRLPPDLSPDSLADDLCHLLGSRGRKAGAADREREEGPQSYVRVAFSGAEAAFRAEKNTPLVRAFLGAIREQGGQPRFVLKTGTSDMNVAGPAWRCPICAYGPGDSALDHTPDERIDLHEYLRSIEILKSVLHTLMGAVNNTSRIDME